MDEIRDDEEQKSLYEESIQGKLDGLAQHHRKFHDDRLFSILIGCLAFYAGKDSATSRRWEKLDSAGNVVTAR